MTITPLPWETARPNAPQLPTPTPAEDMTPEETLEQPDYIEPET